MSSRTKLYTWANGNTQPYYVDPTTHCKPLIFQTQAFLCEGRINKNGFGHSGTKVVR